MIRYRAWGLMGVIAGVLVMAGCSQSEEQCALPTLALSSTSAAAGDNVTVKVENASTGCADQGDAAASPVRSVDVVLVADGRTFVLGSAPTDGDGTATLEAVVPASCTDPRRGRGGRPTVERPTTVEVPCRRRTS
ncbi:Lipoprotein OS=Cellulomonas persica OX=76861 GN=CPE01_21380 PE=4 SV=1 [Cellulomonas persica]|uniref:Lipoprotein n=2 Tax=Cellulomonas persica TaxID=76861 RepID=A0A510V008_9CELL|nr:hypothetical protein CPE01_21380 [Cellulomonas persica]